MIKSYFIRSEEVLAILANSGKTYSVVFKSGIICNDVAPNVGLDLIERLSKFYSEKTDTPEST